MTLQSSGQISMANINSELRLASTSQISLNDTAVRNLLGRTINASTISMSDAYGKSSIPPPVYVQYLLVGGGGGGGTGTVDSVGGGGGGGGGGGLYMNDYNLQSGDWFTVTIGQGGAGGYTAQQGRTLGYYDATDGGTTMISGTGGTVTAGGGQAGKARYRFVSGYGNSEPFGAEVYKGGDGGYGQYTPYGASTPGALAWGPGNSGGTYQTNGGSDGKRAGGGGGGTDDTNNIWNGGDGAMWLNGVYYGGGGGGGGDYSYGGAGGAGGGGGSRSAVNVVTQGTDGLGGGGGGGASYGGSAYTVGARGGSGAVILRYAGYTAKATGGTITYSGGYVYHTFTTNGTFAANF